MYILRISGMNHDIKQMKRKTRVKQQECQHFYIYSYSTPIGDWYVCIYCDHKELRSVK